MLPFDLGAEKVCGFRVVAGERREQIVEGLVDVVAELPAVAAGDVVRGQHVRDIPCGAVGIDDRIGGVYFDMQPDDGREGPRKIDDAAADRPAAFAFGDDMVPNLDGDGTKRFLVELVADIELAEAVECVGIVALVNVVYDVFGEVDAVPYPRIRSESA